jgi:short-subunit dehydrogenase
MEHAKDQEGEFRRGWVVVTGASSGLGCRFALALPGAVIRSARDPRAAGEGT